MDDQRLRVGVDACVLIAGVKCEAAHPCSVIVQMAQRRLFTLVLIENAENETRSELQKQGRLSDLDEVLSACDVERYPKATEAEILAAAPLLWPKMRHWPDIPIAIVLRTALPDFFISSNRDHWRPSLSEDVGGVRIVEPVPFLVAMGVRPSKRRPKR